ALRTVENQSFSVDAMVSGPWHLVGGAAQVEVADSRIVTGEQAFSALTYEAGIKYVSGSSHSIALVGRRLDGEYQESRLDPVNLFDNAFDEDQVEVVGRWAPTGKSSFSGRIAWVDRKHEHIPQRDFEGAVGNLD